MILIFILALLPFAPGIIISEYNGLGLFMSVFLTIGGGVIIYMLIYIAALLRHKPTAAEIALARQKLEQDKIDKDLLKERRLTRRRELRSKILKGIFTGVGFGIGSSLFGGGNSGGSSGG